MILVETQLQTEATKSELAWHINGVFAQASVVNKNRRIYNESTLDRETGSFLKEYVETNRAVGELSHPNHSQINPDRVAIRIESLTKEGSDYHGSALVLNTPCGKIIQAMLEGGVVLGVSTRGSGSVKQRKDGISEVQDDFKLHTIDAVMNPSAPKALVTAVYENESAFETLLSDALLFEQFCDFLKEKKSAKEIPNRTNRETAMLKAVTKVFSDLIR